MAEPAHAVLRPTPVPVTAPPPPAATPSEGQILEAVTRWAGERWLAPRRFHTLITGIADRDEILDRVATCIERRDLREHRVPTGERRVTRPRVETHAIDPFAHDAESLKAASEHVAHCLGCGASGRMACRPCDGTGKGKCPACRGSGTQTSAKTGRPIQCKSCRTTGSAPCRGCAGTGSIHCNMCMGSGHQLAWLTLATSEHWSLFVPEHSTFVIAHPALRERRAIGRKELADAAILGEHAAACPLDTHALPPADRALVEAQLAPVDRRFERVKFQQLIKLAAICRDVTYEMCGARATLSLSGNSLAPATTSAATRPIRRRTWLWFLLSVAVGVLGALSGAALLGASAYYETATGGVALLASVAFAASIPTFGSLLRAWRGGLQFRPVGRGTAIAAACMVGALIAIPIVGVVAKPSLGEIDGALAAHDVTRARAVLAAYKEVARPSAALAAAEDRVLLAEAAGAAGDGKLGLLDQVVAHHGAAAGQAASEARGERLARVRAMIAAHHAGDALTALDHDFAGDPAPEVGEERARAHDQLAGDCKAVACRLDETRQARAAHATPARDEAVRAARGEALQALDGKRIAPAPLATRLQQLAALGATGEAVGKLAADDGELAAVAKTARELAASQRAAVAVLGHDFAVAEALLGFMTKRDDGVAMTSLDGAAVYLTFNRGGACTGLYATGSLASTRALAHAESLLSQAVGHASQIPKLAAADDSSRWSAAGYPVVVRRLAGEVAELRIGDAAP